MHNPWNPAMLMFSSSNPVVNKRNGYYGVRKVNEGAAIWTQHIPISPHSAAMDLVVMGFVTVTEFTPTALADCVGKRVWEVIDNSQILKHFSAADVIQDAQWDAEAEVSAFRVTSFAHR